MSVDLKPSDFSTKNILKFMKAIFTYRVYYAGLFTIVLWFIGAILFLPNSNLIEKLAISIGCWFLQLMVNFKFYALKTDEDQASLSSMKWSFIYMCVAIFITYFTDKKFSGLVSYCIGSIIFAWLITRKR